MYCINSLNLYDQYNKLYKNLRVYFTNHYNSYQGTESRFLCFLEKIPKNDLILIAQYIDSIIKPKEKPSTTRLYIDRCVESKEQLFKTIFDSKNIIKNMKKMDILTVFGYCLLIDSQWYNISCNEPKFKHPSIDSLVDRITYFVDKTNPVLTQFYSKTANILYQMALETVINVESSEMLNTVIPVVKNNELSAIRRKASLKKNDRTEPQYKELEKWILENFTDFKKMKPMAKIGYEHCLNKAEEIFKDYSSSSGKQPEIYELDWYYNKTREIIKKHDLVI